VLLVRDENANLVWGIEQTVRVATGEPRRGREFAAQVVAHRQQLRPPSTPDHPRAPVAYEAMNSIAEHWIPFIPVHVPGDNRSIQLQRAALPSVVDAAPVAPRTSLLREGIDTGQPYFINEEEVPRAGTRLGLAYQRTRLRDGRVLVWLTAERRVGRGEGASGLGFDLLTPTSPV
jgi:hypothetical protein